MDTPAVPRPTDPTPHASDDDGGDEEEVPRRDCGGKARFRPKRRSPHESGDDVGAEVVQAKGFASTDQPLNGGRVQGPRHIWDRALREGQSQIKWLRRAPSRAGDPTKGCGAGGKAGHVGGWGGKEGGMREAKAPPCRGGLVPRGDQRQVCRGRCAGERVLTGEGDAIRCFWGASKMI